MFKFLLIISLVFLIVLIARGVAKQYSDKLKFFKNLKSFFEVYKLNIGFKKDKLKKIVENFNTDGEAKELLNSYQEFLDRGGEIKYFSKLISDEDNKIILDSLTRLGQGDFTTEKEQVKITLDYLSKEIEKAKSENDKVVPLIIKLSFLFALLIAILFI